MRIKKFGHRVSLMTVVAMTINYITIPTRTNAGFVEITKGLPILSTPKDIDKPTKTPKLSLDFEIASGDAIVSDNVQNKILYQGGAPLAEGGFSYEGVTLTADERRYIANVVEHEVGGCPDSFDYNPEHCPKMNVACSVLNRYVTDYWEFPSTIQEVILQRYAYSGISAYWNRTDYASEDSYKAVDMVLEAGDITGGCYWFRNKAITGWNAFFDGASTITWMFQDSAGHEYYKLKG